MATRNEDQPNIKPNGDRPDEPIVTKVSGKDLDQTIERLSQATVPYFRPGGALMPEKP